MAERPIFVPLTTGNSFYSEERFSFHWNPGFAPVQKKRNIQALHEAAANSGFEKVLEVSTKSDQELGCQLSAFNLTLRYHERSVCLESAFQGSKVFESGGPYTDIYSLDGRSAKRDTRVKSSGKLIAFEFDSEIFPLSPKSAFYDWLYLNAIYSKMDIREELVVWEAFSDIEFNPLKSINCQARSCAIVAALELRGMIDDAIESFGRFSALAYANKI